MKTKIIFALMGCALITPAYKCFSQLALNTASDVYMPQTTLVTKKDFIDTSTLKLNAVANNIKVERSFVKLFGEDAENNWSMVGKNFLNRFHSKGLLTNVLFTKDGRLVYKITYGTEKDLTADVRTIVKQKYFDYSISMAIEITEDKRSIWVVKLDTSSEEITVRIEDGEMEQVQQFQKVAD